ncbi:MAG: hypothetical protein KDD36_00140 [Flavobacteriales bacterium]|nr:hypothetical protein [Flavobacteriales bacterium]
MTYSVSGKAFILITFMCMMCGLLYAQQPDVRLVLMNGDTLHVTSADTLASKVIYQVPGKEKEKSMSRYRVFLIVKGDNELWVYDVDTLEGDDYSRQEMAKYIRGIYDARQNYHTGWLKAPAFLVGGGSAILGPLYGLVPQVVYVSLIGNISPRKETGMDEKMKDDFYYREGYTGKARNKRTRHSAASSFLGFLTGLVVYQQAFHK